MPVNENQQGKIPVRSNQTFDEPSCETAAFSSERLAAMNQVLIALLHAVSLPVLLQTVHKIISRTTDVSAWAYYTMTEDGHLRLDCGAGQFGKILPDVVSPGSETLASMRSSSYARPISTAPLQRSLFDDAPVVSYWAVESNGAFAGALACVYAVESEDFVNAVCSQILASIEFLHQSHNHLGFGQVSKEIAGQAIDMEPADGVAVRLTGREREVLSLVCQGLCNKEIAAKLYISLPTCKHHIENILIKLGVHSRAAAVAIGLGLSLSRSQSLQAPISQNYLGH